MKLNIGPGQSGQGDKKIDLHPYPGVTDIADIAVDPLPYPDDFFDTIEASHVLEHIPTCIRWREAGQWHRRFARVELMREIYRVLKPGGYFTATVPVEWPRWAQDPTHDSVPWCQEQFGYFCGQWGGKNPGHEATESSGIDFAFEWVRHNQHADGLTVVMRKPNG